MQVDVPQLLPRSAPAAIPAPIPGVGTAGALLRPDRSTNFAPLAPLSMGEAWHNAHHAFPMLARHGVDRRQLDTSASVIRLFERLGWAIGVNWPDQARLATRRIS